MKIPKLLIIYSNIAFIIMMFCLAMIFNGKVTVILHGYGVDSTGRLYLGKDSKIEVYEKGELINSFSSKTSRGYMFTVQIDDTILLSTGDIRYILDLNGNVISKEDDYRSRTYTAIEYKPSAYKAADGNIYKIRYPWGRTEIICSTNGKVIYRMPDDEFIIRLLFFTVFISVFIFVPIIIHNWRKINKEKDGTTQGSFPTGC